MEEICKNTVEALKRRGFEAVYCTLKLGGGVLFCLFNSASVAAVEEVNKRCPEAAGLVCRGIFYRRLFAG